MADFPAENYITNTGRYTSEVQDSIEAWLAATKQLPGGLPPSELTIASGAITVDRAVHSVDTEGDAASDNLDAINLSQVHDGHVVILYAENDSRTVTVRHLQGGSGQIRLMGADSVELSTDRVIRLVRNGTEWKQIDFVSSSDTNSGRQKTYNGIPGTYTWTVPDGITKVWVSAWGGGGGGGGGGGTSGDGGNGTNGTASSVSGTGFTTKTAVGGAHGYGGENSPVGTTDVTRGGAPGQPYGHEGGIGLPGFGGRGGARSQPPWGYGAGGRGGLGAAACGGGGSGSHSSPAVIEEPITVTPGQTLTIEVGTGGAAGAAGSGGGNPGYVGINGIVILKW